MRGVVMVGHAWHLTVHVVLVLAVGAAVVVLGRWIVPRVLRHVDARTEAPMIQARHKLPGGAWIGMLERLSIYAALMAHYPEAIAVAMALKGVARYPELKAPDSGAAELFIIGTFASVLLACAGAGLAMWLVTLW